MKPIALLLSMLLILISCDSEDISPCEQRAKEIQREINALQRQIELDKSSPTICYMRSFSEGSSVPCSTLWALRIKKLEIEMQLLECR